MERFVQDYGYDAAIYTYNQQGELENGAIFVQLKATEHLKHSKKHKAVEFSLSKRDLEVWLDNPLPVVLMLYHVSDDVAYYLELQHYFTERQILLQDIVKFTQVFISPQNVLTPTIVKALGDAKNDIFNQFKQL